MAVPGKVSVHPDAQEFSFSASYKRLPFKKRSKVGWFTCCSFCRVAMRSGFVFFALGTIWFDVNHRLAHPRSPRGSQSGQEKRPDESFQARAEETLGTDSHRTISSGQANAGSWLGTKMLCIIVPNRRTVSPEFLSWVRTRVQLVIYIFRHVKQRPWSSV